MTGFKVPFNAETTGRVKSTLELSFYEYLNYEIVFASDFRLNLYIREDSRVDVISNLEERVVLVFRKRGV